MELGEDAQQLIEVIKSGKKILAMVAPSFVVDFKYPDVVVLLKKMGIEKVCELTFGARIVTKHYHDIIKKHQDRLFISSTCPVVVNMIKKMYPDFVKYLMPVVSPLGATAKVMKKNYPEYVQVFISPCPAKKDEGEMYGFDITLTYKELKELEKYAKKNNMLSDKGPSHLFDKFYDDITKVYPLSGGLTKTLKREDILKDDELIIVEGPIQLKELLSKEIPKKVRFLDVLFCEGGCIGGPGIATKDPIKVRHKKVIDYMEFAKNEDVGTSKGLMKDTEGIKFNTPKKYIDNKYFVESN